jgi:putative hemolysin
MNAVAVELLIVGLLILLNGALAMAEMALVSSRKARLEQWANAGDQRARAALELANEPTRFLSTVQVGITLLGILAGAFGGATISQAVAAQVRGVPPLSPYAEAIGLGIVVIAITFLTLIFGELVPKRLALNSPERIASLVARPMRLLSRLAGPVVHLLGAATSLTLHLLRVRPVAEAPVTEEEIEILIEQGRRAGVFEAAEQQIVEAVFRLGDRRVSSLMTPRPEVVWIDIGRPADESLRTVLGSPHARFPVCRGSLDEILGLVVARDVLARHAGGQPLDLAALVERPLFVPETLHAYRLLERFKQHGCHVAVVIDEFGGVQGIVTVADIFEALVGDIPAAGETADADVVRREDGSLLVDGTLSIDELKEVLGVETLPVEARGDFYTVGGLMMARLGRIPALGDRFDWEDKRFEVVDMDGNRVDKVLIAPIPSGGRE